MYSVLELGEFVNTKMAVWIGRSQNVTVYINLGSE